MDFCIETVLTSRKTVEKFEEFRQNDKFCDISLFSGHALVKAHRVVLAASCPYFEAMFNVGLKESQEVFINLPSIPPDVLPLLVDFIYTGRVRISDSTVQQLMAAAHMLQMQDLVKCCIKYLKSHLHPSHALKTFRFAETFGCSELAEHVLVYIGKHWAAMTQSEGLLDLPLPDFVKILSSNKFVVNNELDVVVSVVRWLEHDPSARVHHWDKLMPLLYLGRLSANVLDDVWKNVKNTKLKYILDTFSMGMMAQANLRSRGHTDFYIVGGNQSGFTVATVFKYNAHKNDWEVIAPMATPRNYLSVAVLMDRLYAVGGVHVTTTFASGEVYDPTTNEWSPIAAMNTARCKFALAALDGRLYAFGGNGAAGTLASIEVYDPEADVWAPAGDMPHARCEMAAVTYDDAVYLTGGKSDIGSQRALLRYEVTTGSGGEWRACADLSCERSQHAAAVLGDRLYVIGGVNAQGYALNTVARYDFETERWEDVAPMNAKRCDCMAGAIGGALLVAGANEGSSKPSVEMYEVNKNRWRTGSSMPVACCGAGYAAL